MTDTTPAGWYPAPHAGNELRYWDGSTWHAAPPFLPAGAGTPAGPSANAPGVPPVPQPYGQVPPYAAAPPAYAAAPPYAAQGMPPAAYGAPSTGYPPYGGAIVPGPPQGLAVAALVLGIAAFLSAWIPFLGLIIALVGAIIGVLALVRRQRKALAVTGTVLSGLGLAWALIVTISLSSIIWAPTPSYEDPDVGAAPAPDASPSPGEGFDSFAPESGPGSVDDPLPLPYVAGSSAGDDYRAEVRLVDEDATDEVLAWNEYNGLTAQGMRYVLVEMTVTGLDPEGTEAAYASYDLSLATPDGKIYPSAFVVAPEDSTMLSDAGTVAEGETVEGLVAYLVPEDATDLLLSDYANFYSF
ncbi:DUF2510 domain-containing protein [Microbacterium sp. NPDC077663]|uniref:DUF2510 domain-containing protein n=1 Tax=Microbacterium sp. NPDC077663 TaxID=3364189 RepID=UPI0037C8049A